MDASLRSAQRLLGQWVPHVRAADAAGSTLETLPAAAESPRLVSPGLVEGASLRARRVPGTPVAACGGFLDGTQASRVVGYAEGIPIVHGTVAAVIRARRNRRLVTYGHGPLIDRSLYIPRALVPARLWDTAASGQTPVIDTSDGADAVASDEPAVGAHPAALTERAVHCVRRSRQRLERALAERWCAVERVPLYIDGGLSGSESVANSPCSVGVVKRHGTLYVEQEALSVLAGLARGQRTTAFRIAPARRRAVVSWYLRLRDSAGRDPLWGLVRIEVAEPDPSVITQRADDVSRWVMAETAPVALPDPRWHTMAYGVRDCEEFLRSII